MTDVASRALVVVFFRLFRNSRIDRSINWTLFIYFIFSPSDLDADDEDNQNQSDSTVSSLVQVPEQQTRARPGTPTGDTIVEVTPMKNDLSKIIISWKISALVIQKTYSLLFA